MTPPPSTGRGGPRAGGPGGAARAGRRVREAGRGRLPHHRRVRVAGRRVQGLRRGARSRPERSARPGHPERDAAAVPAETHQVRREHPRALRPRRRPAAVRRRRHHHHRRRQQQVLPAAGAGLAADAGRRRPGEVAEEAGHRRRREEARAARRHADARTAPRREARTQRRHADRLSAEREDPLHRRFPGARARPAGQPVHRHADRERHSPRARLRPIRYCARPCAGPPADACRSDGDRPERGPER